MNLILMSGHKICICHSEWTEEGALRILINILNTFRCMDGVELEVNDSAESTIIKGGMEHNLSVIF